MDILDEGDVNQIIRGVLENVLGEVKSFEQERVAEWTNAIVHQCLHEIVELNKPFKYIVTCNINQRNGAGLFAHSLCYFDVEEDLLTQVSWNNDVLSSNVTIYAMVLN
jgi:dynein light chain Tctex-type 1